ncbi:MAG TPA: N-6 DNA methylase [Bacteroidota bacterium]|nr:N-6 DNA methylase [Bacteroidota bacterium]
MSPAAAHTTRIGAFFTPLAWAKWVVEKNRLFGQWLEGGVVFDPTAGEGNFLEAFIAIAVDRGMRVTEEMTSRLTGVEREKDFVENFFRKMRSVYGIDFPRKNFSCEDYISSGKKIKADVIVGNPPWQNFCDLPSSYKEFLKPYFRRYHLVENGKDVLLGGSRIDIAALVIAKSLTENLAENGRAYFFLPLSILLNGGAHSTFRNYKLGEIRFAVEQVYDFKHHPVFDGVGTRYGLAVFRRDAEQLFPIPYFLFESERWKKYFARPAGNANDPLSVQPKRAPAMESFSRIEVPSESKPRQGVNTCGANSVFIFDSLAPMDGDVVLASSASKKGIPLPSKYLFPLAAKDNFEETEPVPHRFILLPYHEQTGKPLGAADIEKEPTLHAYLLSQKSVLENRKGTLINSWISKGCWWALLGVGRYSFLRHKIMWEAFGRKTYRPKIFSGRWQGNQALHAYIPTDDRLSAADICTRLRHPAVQRYLSSQQMEGTCNWAQPGRISGLLSLTGKQRVPAPAFPSNSPSQGESAK